MTHGIEDFFISPKGDFDFSYSGFYSTSLKAEPLWNVTAEAGKKTLVWHWPGGAWPPTSDSENLMVVDGTSAGALGYNAMGRDMDMMAVASTKANISSALFLARPHVSSLALALKPSTSVIVMIGVL